MPRRSRFVLHLALITAGVALMRHAVFAFQSTSDFVPVDQLGKQESVPGGTLVVAAYAFAWVAVTVYLWTIWRRAARIERELADVNAKLAARPARQN